MSTLSKTWKNALSQTTTISHAAFWREISAESPSHVSDLIKTEQETKKSRVEEAFQTGTATDASGKDQQLFDKMWLGQDLEDVNTQLLEDFTNDLMLTKARKEDPRISPIYDLYHLTRNTRLVSFYYCFGSKSTLHPNRLDLETEEILLELLWWRTLEKNDIAMPRRSTWWIAGSENHDLNTKTVNLLTSAIFSAEPEFSERVYPNFGYGCAPGYMSAGYHSGAGEDPRLKGKERANWSDGKQYTPKDHYAAWNAFFKEYLAERARKGFFLENGSPGYMQCTISYLLLVLNFCPDKSLKKQVGMFLDLFWTDWALQQLGGLRGGPKTRHHNQAGSYDSMSEWARFYLGGPGNTSSNYAQQLIGDYAFDPLIWEMVIDRQGLGSFCYVSRGLGEEESTCPRPYGVERAMMGNTESRMTKYSWITPDYILGTQMDHPTAVHNHLSAHGRWQGLITSDLNSRIVTVSLAEFPGKTDPDKDYCLELMYHSAQSKQVLITQQRRRWTQINPDWFPTYDQIYDVDFGVFVGSGWQTRTELDGWLFLQQNETYAAIRILRLKTDSDPMAFAKGTDRYEDRVELEDESYTWNDDHTVLRLINKFSPIIIEAGSRKDYPQLEDFQRRILSNKMELYKTVATHETKFILVYQGVEVEEIVFNAANPLDIPTIGGKYVDYECPMTFDAPYLQADYGSGVIEICKGDSRLAMDFNTITSKRLIDP